MSHQSFFMMAIATQVIWSIRTKPWGPTCCLYHYTWSEKTTLFPQSRKWRWNTLKQNICLGPPRRTTETFSPLCLSRDKRSEVAATPAANQMRRWSLLRTAVHSLFLIHSLCAPCHSRPVFIHRITTYKERRRRRKGPESTWPPLLLSALGNFCWDHFCF